MKHTEYKVVFATGQEIFFYALGFKECIIIAQYAAVQDGKDPTISKIYDQYGQIAVDIKNPSFTIQP